VNAPRGASQRHRSLESRLEIERLTSGLEGGCWKSALSSNSLAAYPTSRTVLREPVGEIPICYSPSKSSNFNGFQSGYPGGTTK
jgi:hypothetical protein